MLPMPPDPMHCRLVLLTRWNQPWSDRWARRCGIGDRQSGPVLVPEEEKGELNPSDA